MSFSSNLTSALIRKWTEFLFKNGHELAINWKIIRLWRTLKWSNLTDQDSETHTNLKGRTKEKRVLDLRFTRWSSSSLAVLLKTTNWGGGGVGRVGDVHEVVPPSSDSFFNRSLLESPHVPHFNVFFPVVSTDFPLVTHVKSWKKQQL